MYDEHIKSRLIKDIRFFRETKDQSDQKVREKNVPWTGTSNKDLHKLDNSYCKLWGEKREKLK